MIKHRYGNRYLHNGALEISYRGLELSEDLLLIGHFIFDFIFTINLVSNVCFVNLISWHARTTKLPGVLASSRLSPSQLTDVSMYCLAEVEVASPYPRIQDEASNCGYQSCFKITNYCLWIEIDRKDGHFVY
ncbi:hypothetical protein T4B_7129 [Trichinella pseudospiralis]|uniref:Uncharacterized protein n=1 Tax=Trichinella pseudospiralis TaxID=6337 RepID=A0A0V1JZ92_TRIPS|nr:hypothetical protein T4A_11286 [Trichinella pseudospiralis]KRZ25173.1 hypothetical protein T4B_7129 [Trichinella pseudospiralis]KRZ40184.1 hypothetical protein T4C_5228 [Trichinella pseudospiralis]